MNEFIRRLTEQMRCVKAREGVAREVSDHILDQAAAYEETGMEHDKAVEMAVHEMGDPVEIGVSLDRIHRPQMNWKLILVTFVLTMAGLFVMYSIYGMSTIVSRQCVFAAAGMAVILAVNFIDYSVIGRFGSLAYILLTGIFHMWYDASACEWKDTCTGSPGISLCPGICRHSVPPARRALWCGWNRNGADFPDKLPCCPIWQQRNYWTEYFSDIACHAGSGGQKRYVSDLPERYCLCDRCAGDAAGSCASPGAVFYGGRISEGTHSCLSSQGRI